MIVADDDPAVRWFFAQLLEDEGASVVQAEDGAVALAAARAEPPDVIVSDILMPNMDGLALCRALSRATRACRRRRSSCSAGARTSCRACASCAPGPAATCARRPSPRRSWPRCATCCAGARSSRRACERVGRCVGVEGLGIPCLLPRAARARERAAHGGDAFNLFEVEVQQRAIVSVSSTATDGGFAAATARCACWWASPPASRWKRWTRGAAQHGWRSAAARRGRGLCAARRAHRPVSGEALARVESLGLDEDAPGSFEASAPGEVDAVAAALSAGPTPRQLLVGSIHAPQAEEAALIGGAPRGHPGRARRRRGRPGGHQPARGARHARTRSQARRLHRSRRRLRPVCSRPSVRRAPTRTPPSRSCSAPPAHRKRCRRHPSHSC
ncbi:MAG: response regulator [Sandaracinaceae bacterium]|nr:response regulator [Sandaracinaceae bacterium]